MELTQELVRRLFEYRDGELYWKTRPRSDFKTDGRHANWNQRYSFQKAGSTAGPYVNVSINKKRYQAHALIFLWHHGVVPKVIDHINRDRHDNNIENLRSASVTQNLLNSKRSKSNTSGEKNVVWSSQKNKWQVKIGINRKTKSFGFYEDLDLAGLVAYEVRRLYCGEYANHG